MKRKPLIGITIGRRNMETPGGKMQNVYAGCPIEYLEAVERSGGAPILLPRSSSGETIAAALDAVDALLLSGGGDIVSLFFGQEPHPMNALQDPIRDEMEIQATRLAVERGMPILGVCRGAQILNVAFGGGLLQHISPERPGAIQHFTRAADRVLVHSIDIEPDSLLGEILGVETTAVNSWHHQAVDAPASGLRVSARARDGVIEAIEAEDGRPILGVQCHPEDCCRDYPRFQKIFDWLVEEARKFMSLK